MTWLQTHSGIAFDLLDPKPEMVSAVDIAWALGRTCRYAGHTLDHYSVAEHSCLIHDHLLGETGDADIARWGLFHDAHEAYIGDMPAPVKMVIGKAGRDAWLQLERKIDAAIMGRFDFVPSSEARRLAKEADVRILLDERDALLGPPPRDWKIPVLPLGVQIECWPAERATSEWIRRLA